jgi:extracellular factor (EF) 3-hydroxypalmitic acid methyl ester biosynthesis protein
MSQLIEEFFTGEVANFTATMERLSRQIDPAAQPQADQLLREFSDSSELCLAGCRRVEAALHYSPQTVRAVQARFREAIGPWFSRSAFMKHALAKPRGYAGDYEMLIAIYERRPRTLGFGGYLDLYFLQTELGRAVPARLRGVRDFLRDEVAERGGPVTALDIACGPAREFTAGFALPEHCQLKVICVDHDDAALDYVRTHVAPQTPFNVELECVKHNALRMMSGDSNRRHFGAPDIIYSVGLCDYIPDEIMIRLLRGWRETVADGGAIYVAFKDCLRYNAARYQWLVDWHFFQRTEADCLQLFDQAGYDVAGMEMVRDNDLGTIMNFISRVPVAPLLRIDRPAAIKEARVGAASETVKFAPAE